MPIVQYNIYISNISFVLLRLSGMMLGTKLFLFCLNEYWILQIACVCSIIAMVMTGLASSTTLLFIGMYFPQHFLTTFEIATFLFLWYFLSIPQCCLLFFALKSYLELSEDPVENYSWTRDWRIGSLWIYTSLLVRHNWAKFSRT